jgi:hypothetical protein
MLTGKIKVRVWYNPRNKSYKMRVGDIELKVTPYMVCTNDDIVAVGDVAKTLYNALISRNKPALRLILPTLLYVANLYNS